MRPLSRPRRIFSPILIAGLAFGAAASAGELGEAPAPQGPAGLVERLSAQQTLQLSVALGLDLSQPPLRQALDRIAAVEGMAVAGDPQQLAHGVEASLERFARERLEQVHAHVDDSELKQDLAALGEVKAALPEKLREAVAQSQANYGASRVQAQVERARRDWTDKSREELASASSGASGAKAVGLGPALEESRRGEAFGAASPPAVWDAPAAQKTSAWSAILGAGRRRWQDWRASPSSANPAAAVSLPRLISAARVLSNLPDDDLKSYRRRYDDWFEDPAALAGALDSIERQESLSPARLDTLVYHQAGQRDDAIVELVNNGVDTLIEKAGLKDLVGRFGVGAFQVLQELEKPGDRVILETAAQPGKVRRLTFSLAPDADPKNPAPSIRLSLGFSDDPSFGAGTRVRVVKAAGLDGRRQEALRVKLAARLGQSPRAPIVLDGRVLNSLDGWKDERGDPLSHLLSDRVEVSVTGRGYEVRDHGLGMDARTLIEKYLVPRRSTKSPPSSTRTQLFYRGDPDGQPGELTKMQVSLSVAGVTVERFEVEGLQLPREAVLELPPGSWLPESRNKIAVTPQVWAGLRAVTDEVLRGNLEKSVGLLNALTAIVAHLENPRTHPEAAKTGEDFARFMAARLDRVPGLKRIPGFEGARRAYTMPFKDKSRVYLEYGDSLIFDQDVYEKYKDFPLLLNLVMNFHVGYGDQKPAKGLFAPPKAREKEKPRADPVRQALEAQAWFAALASEAQGQVVHYVERRLESAPPGERDSALAAEVERLGGVGRLAQQLLPGVDWTRGLSRVKDVKPLPESFHVPPTLAWIGGELAVAGTDVEGRWSIFLGGKQFLPERRFNFIDAVTDIGGKLFFAARQGGVWTAYWDGKAVWKGEAVAITNPILIGGKLAFVISYQNRTVLHVGDEDVWIHESPDTVTELIAVGKGWAMKLNYLGRSDAALIYRDGVELWRGPADQTLSKLFSSGDKLYFLGNNGKVGFNFTSLFVDGRPQGESFGSHGNLTLIGNEPAYVFEVPNENKLRAYIGEKLVWTGPGSDVRALTNVNGRLAFTMDNGRGRRSIIFDGQTIWSDEGERGRAWPLFLTPVGDRLAYAIAHLRVYGKSYEIFIDRQRLWAGEAKSVSLFGSVGGELLYSIRKDDTETYYLSGRLIHEVRDRSVVDYSFGKDHAVIAGNRVALAAHSGDGIWQVIRSAVEDIPRLETEALADPAVRTFAAAHAYDLQDADRPWGERYVRNLLQGVGAAPLSEVQALLPFLESAEWRALSPKTREQFSRLASREPWAKVEEATQFLRLTRPLTQDDAEWDRWTSRWLTLVEADWGRAKELLGELQNRFEIGPIDAKRTDVPDVTIRVSLKERPRSDEYLDDLREVHDKLAEIIGDPFSQAWKAGPAKNDAPFAFVMRVPAEKAVELVQSHLTLKLMRMESRKNTSAHSLSLASRSGLHLEFDAEAIKAMEEVKASTKVKVGVEFDLNYVITSMDLSAWWERIEKDLGVSLSREDKNSLRLGKTPIDVPSSSVTALLQKYAGSSRTLPDGSRVVEVPVGIKYYVPSAQPDAKKSITGLEFLRQDQDVRQAPGHLRGYLYYLRAAHAELLKDRPAAAAPAQPPQEKLEDTPLAYLTMARRQRSRALDDPALTLSGYKKILKSLSGYSTQAMDEEIASAIAGQDLGDTFWVRELVQNSRDALRAAWRDKTLAAASGSVSVDSYKSGGDWVVEVKDPVGMSLAKLANYFFPLDESDKLRGRDAGQFGQGLYTLFGDFDEVRVKTGDGRGQVFDIHVARGQDGRLLVKKWERRAGDFRGTDIQRVKKLDRGQALPPELEAAFVTQAVYEYTAGVQDVPIYYQGEKVNETLTEVAAVDVAPWGKLRVLESPSRLPRVTQDNLTVADPGLRAELLALLPDWLRKLWQERGWTLDLPEGLPLARSRAGLAQKEKTLDAVQKAALAASVQLAVKLYFKEGLTLPGLPQDFYSSEAGHYGVGLGSARDAEKLRDGRWADVDWDRYVADPQALSELIALTPTRMGGEMVSPWTFRKAAQEGHPPTALSEMADSVRGLYHEATRAIAERAEAVARPRKDYSSEEIEADPSLRAFRDLNLELLELLGERGWSVQLYEHQDDTAAYFKPGKKAIFWNLANERPLVERWSRILHGEDSDVYGFFYDFLEIMLHEYTHYTDQGWTHHADEHLEGGFAWRMRRNIEKLIRAGADLPALARGNQVQSFLRH